MADPAPPRDRKPVSRRDALRATGAASLGLLVGGRANSAAALAGGARASGRGAPGARRSANAITQSVARWCFEEIPLVPFCRGVADIGLTAMDLLTVEEWPVAHDHGLTVSCGDVAAGTIEDGLNEAKNHAGIIGAFERHIPHAARVAVPNVICFFGNRRGMEDGVGIENSIACLEACAPIAESEGVTILVEVLNSKSGGHVDYIGDRMDYALEIIRAVDSPRVKILYDIYHMQIMEGDVIRMIRDNIDHIAHFHTGGNPGRHEIDDTQELNYKAISKAIADLEFDGYFAHEFIPQRDPMTSLREAVELCTV